MKKLIAISVIFALVVGSAFAVDLSGVVFGNIIPAQGDSKKDSKIGAGGGMSRLRIDGSGENDDGTFGGYIRMQGSSVGGQIISGEDYAGLAGLPYTTEEEKAAANKAAEKYNVSYAVVQAWGNVWWKPIDQVKLLIGGNGGDGMFGLDANTRWGFYNVAGDVGVISESWAFGDSFYGGFNEGFVATITPMDALEINVGVPFHNKSGAWNIYSNIAGQVKYTMDGIGTFGLTFTGGKGYDKYGDGKHYSQKVFVFAGLGLIEGLGINIGVGYGLPSSGKTADGDAKTEEKPPIAIGLGLAYSGGQFGADLRAQVKMLGEKKTASTKTKEAMGIVVDVQPYFQVNDNLTVLLSAGVNYVMAVKNDGVKSKANMSMHIHPYVIIGNKWGAAAFAGFRFEQYDKNTGKYSQDGSPKALTQWSVPIGMSISF